MTKKNVINLLGKYLGKLAVSTSVSQSVSQSDNLFVRQSLIHGVAYN